MRIIVQCLFTMKMEKSMSAHVPACKQAVLYELFASALACAVELVSGPAADARAAGSHVYVLLFHSMHDAFQKVRFIVSMSVWPSQTTAQPALSTTPCLCTCAHIVWLEKQKRATPFVSLINVCTLCSKPLNITDLSVVGPGGSARTARPPGLTGRAAGQRRAQRAADPGRQPRRGAAEPLQLPDGNPGPHGSLLPWPAAHGTYHPDS